MGGPFPPESTPSWVGFGADLASAARALVNQPSVPLVSLAVTLLVGALPTGRQFFFITDAVNVAVFLFLLGWYGAERVFFQRHLEGRPVTLRHLVRLVPAFIGRFLALGVLFGIVFLAFVFGLARAQDIDVSHLGEAGAPVPVSLEVGIAAFFLAMDFALTFVTPALAYTNRSVVRAWNIGLAMIGQAWPRSALYVLCPPLALNLLNYIFPVSSPALRLPLSCVLILVALLAEGAIAAFYLRERGSYSEDGAAYRLSRTWRLLRSPPRSRVRRPRRLGLTVRHPVLFRVPAVPVWCRSVL